MEEILKQQGVLKIPTLEEVAVVVLRNLQQVFDIEVQEEHSLY
jgi:hypothetical protein